MKKLLKISALALALQPLASLAAPVTLQATFDNFDITYDGTGIFTLSFDDAETPDAYPAPGGAVFIRARYDNVITNASFVWNNIALTLDHSQGNTIYINSGEDVITDATIELRLKDANDVAYRLYMPFESYGDFADVSLANLIGLEADEGVAVLNPVGATPINGRFFLIQESPLTPVPVPATAWLFGSAVLGLAGMAKRRKN